VFPAGLELVTGCKSVACVFRKAKASCEGIIGQSLEGRIKRQGFVASAGGKAGFRGLPIGGPRMWHHTLTPYLAFQALSDDPKP
jgi:hypothetical protein